MLRVLDLFSGIGGFSLGLEMTGGFKTVAFCEIDAYCQRVLRKHWPDVPIFDDVRKLNAETLADAASGKSWESKAGDRGEGVERGSEKELHGNSHSRRSIDLICGGYPCQPFSHAGKRGGEEDDRHLWPEMHRIVASIRPRWVIAENVAGHISMGIDQVLSDLEGEGYTCWPLVIPACAVDAPHRRDRVWIVGHAERPRGAGGMLHAGNVTPPRSRGTANPPVSTGAGHLALALDAEVAGEGPRPGECGSEEPARRKFESCLGRMVDGLSQKLDGRGLMWAPEPPDVPRVATGVKDRVNRLRGLGNAVVPQVVAQIGRAILEAENELGG